MYSERFSKALVFVTELHKGQVRKGTNIPYVSHLLAVASIVMEHEGSEDQVIAALLHDAIEDQADSFPGGASALREEIKTQYGDKVLEIIENCTDADVQPKPPWRERKERYLEHLAHVPEDTLLISLADKLHNARSILNDYDIYGDDLWSRFKGGKTGTVWYYLSLYEAFNERDCYPALLEQFAGVIGEFYDLLEEQIESFEV